MSKRTAATVVLLAAILAAAPATVGPVLTNAMADYERAVPISMASDIDWP